jgi:hypothetical protein
MGFVEGKENTSLVKEGRIKINSYRKESIKRGT